MATCLKVPLSKISKALGPLPQIMPVSSGPKETMRLPWQIVTFSPALQVSNDGGGGLSSCAAAGWTATKANAIRDSSRTKRQLVTRKSFIVKLLFFLLLSERKRSKTRLDFSNPFICVSPHYLNDTKNHERRDAHLGLIA